MLEYANITKIDLSHYDVYITMSLGYSLWSSQKTRSEINDYLNGENSNNLFKDPVFLNNIGIGIMNTPYTQDSNGVWSFNSPSLLYTVENDVSIMNKIGEINKRLIMPILKSDSRKLSGSMEFVLYNDRIDIIGEDLKNDVNYVNIITNVFAIYLAQNYRRSLT